MRKHILIVGGAGYLGNHLAGRIMGDNRITIIDSFIVNSESKSRLNEKLSRDVEIIRADVRDYKKFKSIAIADVLVYAASLNSRSDSGVLCDQYLANNVEGMREFFSFLQRDFLLPKKIILTSSRAVYGEGRGKSTGNVESDPLLPLSFYGVTKMWQENIALSFSQEHNIDLDVFRIFNIFGTGQSEYYSHIGVVSMLARKIADNEEVVLHGNGLIERDYIFIDDVVEILAASIRKTGGGRNIWNLGSGRSYSLNDICELFSRVSGAKVRKRFVDETDDAIVSRANIAKLKNDFGKEDFISLEEFITTHV